jgi:hypothetical protein
VNIPDYYDIVDERAVVTWQSLRSRRHTSRSHFMQDVEQMLFNARAYNVGVRVRRPASEVGGEDGYADVGPGKLRFPDLVGMVEEFRDNVSGLLNGTLSEAVRPAAVRSVTPALCMHAV